MPQSGSIRTRVRFEGRVQGVGFRATALAIARKHPVSGWVRNEADGGVCLEAQGSPEDVEALLQELRSTMSRFVHREVASTIAALDDPTEGFEIRR